MSAKPSASRRNMGARRWNKALGFALIFGLGYGGCYALVQII